MEVKTKEQFYTLWNRGLFGNKLRTWDRLEQFKNFNGTVSIRYKESMGLCAYNVPAIEVGLVVNEWIKKGAKSNLITLNESAPDNLLIAQGELATVCGELVFRHSDVKGKMRDAMVHDYGIKALCYLKRILFPASLDDLEELRELYPESVIELGIYSVAVGSCPHRNMVIWEVRNY